MWPIERLRKHFRQARVRRAFVEYVTEADVEAALAGPSPRIEPRRATVEFVIVLVHGVDPEDVAGVVGQVCDAAADATARTDAVAGSLIVLTFGGPLYKTPEDADLPTTRRNLAAQLSRGWPEHAVVLHGSSMARIGDYGGERWIVYAALFPRFPRMLETLSTMRPGEMREWADDAR